MAARAQLVEELVEERSKSDTFTVAQQVWQSFPGAILPLHPPQPHRNCTGNQIALHSEQESVGRLASRICAHQEVCPHS